MSGEIKTSVVIDLVGNLERQLKKNTKAVEGFSRSGVKSLNTLDKKTKKTADGFSTIGKRLLGIAAGAKAIKAAGKVIDFDARLTMLQTDGRADAKKIAKLKSELILIANESDVRLSPDLLLEGFDKVIAQTGDFDNAMNNLRTMAKFIRATGTAGEDAGAMIAIAFKNGLTEIDQVREFLGVQYQQSQSGSVPIRELARTGKGLFSPVTASAGASAQTLSDAGAVAQITIDAVKSADEAAEAIKSMVSALNTKKVQDTLAKAGVQVRQKDSILLRRLPELIPEIYQAAGGDFGKLGQLFGESGVKVFQGYSKPNGRERLEELAAIKADGSLIDKNARINASTAKAGTQSLNNKMVEVSDSVISKPAKNLADAADTFQSTDWQTNTKAILYALGQVGYKLSTFNLMSKLWAASDDDVKEQVDNSSEATGNTPSSEKLQPQQQLQQPQVSNSKIELEIHSAAPVTVSSIQSDAHEITVNTGLAMSGN
ncbi:phage tail tape measure protein [Methylophaga nitratireducenticrescens]|uniref:phage tail tape measure protein n=1 Tax=Methylophaga nitratireducenticrescens TaxID=754476 RepID=UPI000CDBC604|nr:phage tail tape measure protein [Methylophaga nitratireducenticrescens]AUZ85787.1 hypothetical protein CDW43_14985 [Methylophaga nitratireducenticrescens]AUZ85844.1 hypothetical protein CDW43_15285 [Methylophaga nitratireducenticrescens]